MLLKKTSSRGQNYALKDTFFYFIKVQSLHGYVLKSYYLDKQNVTQGFRKVVKKLSRFELPQNY